MNIRSFIRDITDETNQSKGYMYCALWIFIYNIGCALQGILWDPYLVHNFYLLTFSGGFLGGLLARPAVQYPSVFSQVNTYILRYLIAKTGLFGKYPYLLPCIVGFAINTIGFITGYFFLIDVKKPTKEIEGNHSIQSTKS